MPRERRVLFARAFCTLYTTCDRGRPLQEYERISDYKRRATLYGSVTGHATGASPPEVAAARLRELEMWAEKRRESRAGHISSKIRVKAATPEALTPPWPIRAAVTTAAAKDAENLQAAHKAVRDGKRLSACPETA